MQGILPSRVNTFRLTRPFPPEAQRPRCPRFCAVSALVVAVGFLAAAEDLTYVEVRKEVIVPNVKRLGVNVPRHYPPGAAQILKNVVACPGLESGLFGMVWHADAGATSSRVPQAFWDTAWNNDALGIGHPADFWNGASYEVVYGPAKGQSGSVSLFTHENQRNVFYLDGPGPAPRQWDVMITRTAAQGPYAALVDPSTTRPGSPGEQSLRLVHQEPSWRAAFVYYMDSAWEGSIGKLMLIQGPWRLSFWAKGKFGGERLRVVFARQDEVDFVDETFVLSSRWEEKTVDFHAAAGVDRPGPYPEGGARSVLALSFFVEDVGGEAWIDDLALLRTDYTNPTVFADPFVERLKELRPGILRYWTEQLGDTLDNQLAEPWARKTHGFSPHTRLADHYEFSLHEFLELCREVGAEPWYVIPPSFSPSELTNLVAYLAAPASSGHPYALRRARLGQEPRWTSVLEEIHLEYGNEMWGGASGRDPFFGASALGGERLGAIAHDRFVVLRSSPYYHPSRFNLIIGGQFGFPGRQDEIEANSSNHDQIALSPYFGVLDVYSSDGEIFLPLFARPFDDVASGLLKQSKELIKKHGKRTELAVYEVNFHTTTGEAPLDVRNDFVTCAAGALALPLYMLVPMRELGIRNQCAFTALQFRYRMQNGEHVRLWGMLRDLQATGRKRPTWLGVELVNQAIMGDLVSTVQSGENPSWLQSPLNGVSHTVEVHYIQSFAWRDGGRYGVVLFNLDLHDGHAVRLVLPDAPPEAPSLRQIAPPSIHANNESAVNVSITTRVLDDFGSPYDLSLPKHSVTAVLWPEGAGAPLEARDAIAGHSIR